MANKTGGKGARSKGGKRVHKTHGGAYRDKEYANLYKKIRRRVAKVDDLNAGRKKRGWKGARTNLYKEIVELNKELKRVAKRKGYDVPTRKRFVRKRVFDRGAKTITYMDKVWQFEKTLRDKVLAKAFNSF